MALVSAKDLCKICIDSDSIAYLLRESSEISITSKQQRQQSHNNIKCIDNKIIN